MHFRSPIPVSSHPKVYINNEIITAVILCTFALKNVLSNKKRIAHVTYN
jgi:hypothetical protein